MKDQLDKRSCREQNKQQKAVAQLISRLRKAPETAMGRGSSPRTPCEERQMDNEFLPGMKAIAEELELPEGSEMHLVTGCIGVSEICPEQIH